MPEVIFTDSNFEAEVLEAQLPVLVDFYADWCGPCKIQGPIIEVVAKEISGQAKVGKLDVEANQATAQKYQVMSIPTIIIFKNGQEVEKMVGVQNKDNLIDKLSKL